MNIFLCLISVSCTILAVEADEFFFRVVASANSTSVFCDETNPAYLTLSRNINKAIEDSITSFSGLTTTQLKVNLCPSDGRKVLTNDQKAAQVIFPILAAGAFVISTLYVRWKNIERADLLARRKGGDGQN